MTHKALITQINPLSSHDGPGARTTFFLKGCSLRCIWCHNPETICNQQDIFWYDVKCIGCGMCIESCPTASLNLLSKPYFINKATCIKCGKCVELCPSKALVFTSKEYSASQVATIILKNKPLFSSMGGGVTFSGGEPILQNTFIERVINEANCPSIHYAIDSCGQAPLKNYISILPKINLLLFDIKEINPIKHKEFTSADNSLILSNLKEIINYIAANKLNTKIWIRTPLIPGYTATKENIKGIGELLSSLNSQIIERWDLCTFNNLCKSKYNNLGEPWKLEKTALLDESQRDYILNIAQNSITSTIKVGISGLTTRKNEKRQ